MTPDPDDEAPEPETHADEDAPGDDVSAPISAQLRQAVAIIVLVALAAGLLIAIVSIMDAIGTWLKPRYADLAQGAFGLVLAGSSLAALAWIAREWDAPDG